MSALRCNRCHTEWQEDNPPYWCPECEEKERLAKYQPVPKPAESQAAGDWIVRAAKEFQVYTPAKDCTTDRLIEIISYFHQFNQSQQLAAAQARIAELTGELDACETHVKIKQRQTDELLIQLVKASARVAVLEKALEGLLNNSAVITPAQDADAFVELQIVKRYYEAAYADLAAQPSREKEGDK